MIKINFNEPDTKDWISWRKRCNKKQQKHNEAIESGRKSKINAAFYKEQKHKVYMNPDGPFHGKCAYCETNIFKNQHGDVEHYRPKDALTDKGNKTVFITKNGQKQPHPGYYWLVYDWKNLLPSCELCNQRSTKHSKGKLIGKWSRFPVKNSNAIRVGEERGEEPLLLHPVYDDPSKHLELDKLGAIIKPRKKSLRGKACIDIFGLNDRELPSGRRTTYKTIRDKMSLPKRCINF